MSLRKANEIDAAYRKQKDAFEKEHEALLRILNGTPLRQDMDVLKDAVDQAFALNIRAGWVSEYAGFDKLEYFEAVIRQDCQGRLVRDRSAIPSDLLGEFGDLNAADFAGYMEELREECRCAYAEIRDLRGDLNHCLSQTFFIEDLSYLQGEYGISESDVRGLQPLLDNIEKLWVGYMEMARSLLHMANELGDSDYDPSLMETLLFD